MKLLERVLLISLFFPSAAFAQFVSVKALGPLSVGSDLPGFSGVSYKGKEIGPTTPKGKFFVHFINDLLPPSCLDDECGAVGKRVAARGGHLIGASDGKAAAQFGVKLISETPWRFNRSLVVIASANGQILGIFDSATMGDIESLVDKYDFEGEQRQAAHGRPEGVQSSH